MQNEEPNNYQAPPNMGQAPQQSSVPLHVASDNELVQQQQEVNRMIGYSIENAKSLMHLGNELAKFITDQRLATNIKGKSYVQVEGWQFAGSMLGLCCIVDSKSLEDLSNPATKELRFRVTARVYEVKSGRQVAEATASCSNKEKGKEYFEAYAVESMTQTRAISKAYRTYLAWLVKSAGFEATPYEEMGFTEDAQSISLATDKQYATIMELAQSEFIKENDLDEASKRGIQEQSLTEKEAKQIIATLKDLIADRNF